MGRLGNEYYSTGGCGGQRMEVEVKEQHQHRWMPWAVDRAERSMLHKPKLVYAYLKAP